MAPKVLVVLTSHDKLGDSGEKTGWFLPELSHPYGVFTSAGWEVTVASPLGGVAPLDPSSIEFSAKDAAAQAFLRDKKAVWEKTAKLSSFTGGRGADEFDAIFYVGGAGPMFDLARDPDSQRLVSEFAAKGKVVGAVCHGPAALAFVKGPDGKPLLDGKQVTGLSNEEEDQGKKTKWMPFPLEDKLREVSGGRYVKAAEPWGVKVVVDGKIVTGQNPASAQATAEAIVKAVQG
jgi:putative intracellular protease/amidase